MLRDWRSKENLFLECHKKTFSRHLGSGRTSLFANIESQLKDWVIIRRRDYKRIISYCTFREQALSFATILDVGFLASSEWIKNFMKTNGFSCRKITSIGQENNRFPLELAML